MDNFSRFETNFPKLETIHRGKHSAVYKGEEKGSLKRVFALKSFDKSHESTVDESHDSTVDESPESAVPQEVKIHETLRHSNIVKFHDWVETSTGGWLIIEYCFGGDLKALLEEQELQGSDFGEDTIHDIARNIVAGLRYLHGKGIVHCDLKPSNILLDGKGTLKLCDFGLSRESSEIPSSSLGPKASKRGSPSYMAPELFHDGGVHSYASDLWSLGCVLYECHAGKPPFIGETLTELIQSILTDPTPPLPKDPDVSFAELVKGLLIKDPRNRIQWTEICTHDFWGFLHQLSPVYLPPQPAFDNMKQLNETLDDENLQRLVMIAKANLHEKEKENDHNIAETDTVDVRIENRDMEFDFHEHTEKDDTPAVDENLSEKETPVQDETDDESRRPEQESKAVVKDSGRPLKPSDMLWHESDFLVPPVMLPPSTKSDKQPNVLRKSALLFDAMPSLDFAEQPKEKFDAVTRMLEKMFFSGKHPITESLIVVQELEILSRDADAANALINSSIMSPLLKMLLRPSKESFELRFEIASLVGLQICKSTYSKKDLSKFKMLDMIKKALELTQEKEVTRLLMAALGELLSYISTIQKGLPESSSTKPGWQVSDALISVVTSRLRNGEDNTTQLYALRTIANMSSKGKYWSTRFSTKEDVINNLCSIFQASDKEETNRLTAGTCLVWLVGPYPPTIKQVMEKLTFTETTIALISKENPEERRICLNLLNMSLLGSRHFSDISSHLSPLLSDEKLIPALASLVEHGGELLGGKSLLFVTLLCRSKMRLRWLRRFFSDGKLLLALESLELKEDEDYLDVCLELCQGEVAAVVPRVLDSLISDVKTLLPPLPEGSPPKQTTSSKKKTKSKKTNLQLIEVAVNIIGSSVFNPTLMEMEMVHAEVFEQLTVLLKLVEPSPFQGRDDMQICIVHMLSMMASYSSIITQNNQTFVQDILPRVSRICKDDKSTFHCIKIWFNVALTFSREPSSHDTEEFKQICQEHFLPLYPELKMTEDPLPHYAERLLELLAECEYI